MLNKLISRISFLTLASALLVGATVDAKAAVPRKPTRVVQVQATPSPVRPGQTLIIRASFEYKDKNGNYVPLKYTSIPLSFKVFGVIYYRNTDMRTGNATLSVTVPSKQRPQNYTVVADFDGNAELKPATAGSTRFTVRR